MKIPSTALAEVFVGMCTCGGPLSWRVWLFFFDKSSILLAHQLIADTQWWWEKDHSTVRKALTSFSFKVGKGND